MNQHVEDAIIDEDIERLKQLMEQGANLEGQVDGWTPLLRAAYEGNTEILNYLLDQGANIDFKDQAQSTPLDWAITNNNTDIARILVERGADIEASDEDDYTPLMITVAEGNFDIVRILLDKGSNIEARDKQGKTSLILAIYEENIRMVEYLLEMGANLHTVSDDGWTALMEAISCDSIQIVELLIDSGVTIDAKNNKGQTALEIAVKNRKSDFVDLIQDSEKEMKEINELRCEYCEFTYPIDLDPSQSHSSPRRILFLLHRSRRAKVEKLLESYPKAEASYNHNLYRCNKCGKFSKKYHIRLISENTEIYETTFKCHKCNVDLEMIDADSDTFDKELASFPCPKCKSIDALLPFVRLKWN